MLVFKRFRKQEAKREGQEAIAGGELRVSWTGTLHKESLIALERREHSSISGPTETGLCPTSAGQGSRAPAAERQACSELQALWEARPGSASPG